MNWTLNNDTLLDEKSYQIGFCLPGTDKKTLQMLKHGGEMFDLLGEFVQTYDAKAKAKKHLIDRFERIIDLSTDYNFHWEITGEGNLVDASDNIICLLTNKNPINSKIIKFLPDAFLAAQKLVNSFNSSTTVKQQPVYKAICQIYAKISEE